VSVAILVVCTANVARSPLAEVMLAASVDVEVVSGGTQAREGDTAAVRSQELAAARGLDLTEHRSKPVTPDTIDHAELVITMSERHRDHCGILVPGAGPKVFTLRELVRLLGASDATTPAPPRRAGRAGPPRTTGRRPQLAGRGRPRPDPGPVAGVGHDGGEPRRAADPGGDPHRSAAVGPQPT
jgi:protein-tyrosine phosphatase